MMDERSSFEIAGVKGLLERIEGQFGAKRVRHPPARPRESGDAPRVGVDDEGGVGEPSPRGHVEPAPVETGVRSDTHRASGRLTVKTRFTRSAGRSASATGVVVFACRPRTAPCSPSRRIRRATPRWGSGAGVQRATDTPSPRS